MSGSIVTSESASKLLPGSKPARQTGPTLPSSPMPLITLMPPPEVLLAAQNFANTGGPFAVSETSNAVPDLAFDVLPVGQITASANAAPLRHTLDLDDLVGRSDGEENEDEITAAQAMPEPEPEPLPSYDTELESPTLTDTEEPVFHPDTEQIKPPRSARKLQYFSQSMKSSRGAKQLEAAHVQTRVGKSKDAEHRTPQKEARKSQKKSHRQTAGGAISQ